MKAVFTFLFIILLASNSVFAQFSRSIAEVNRNEELEVENIKTKPLFVLLNDESPELNKLLQQSVSTNWKLSPSISYITNAELTKIEKENTGQLNILELRNYSLSTMPHTMKSPGMAKGFFSLGLRVIVKRVSFSIHIEPICNDIVHPSDIAFCIKRIEQTIEKKPLDFKNTKLTNSILIICEDDISNDMIIKAKEVYTLPHKIVSREEYEKLFTDTSSPYVFMILSYLGMGTFGPLLFTTDKVEFIGIGKPKSNSKRPFLTDKDFISFKKYLGN
ncbi:hypothetical protein [Hymenobacter wooponensis]|uniref:Uncharacterized protein n=1 Tax=Hymenobacter wooponensis TaxID=1525360 RepID=A0A4Z0MMD4_9BACT|nr:hypothetical protein [Hymenobacter wooponensis]TGD80448.1 hypothetical protein EU557_11455 [Hymenobacter wooponensis]